MNNLGRLYKQKILCVKWHFFGCSRSFNLIRVLTPVIDAFRREGFHPHYPRPIKMLPVRTCIISKQNSIDYPVTKDPVTNTKTSIALYGQDSNLLPIVLDPTVNFRIFSFIRQLHFTIMNNYIINKAYNMNQPAAWVLLFPKKDTLLNVL